MDLDYSSPPLHPGAAFQKQKNNSCLGSCWWCEEGLGEMVPNRALYHFLHPKPNNMNAINLRSDLLKQGKQEGGRESRCKTPWEACETRSSVTAPSQARLRACMTDVSVG